MKQDTKGSSMRISPEISGISKLECAKGADRASCGETVVQRGVFGESVFFSAPLRFWVIKPLKAFMISIVFVKGNPHANHRFGKP